jgi:thiol:disulfide interchange protein DsbD
MKRKDITLIKGDWTNYDPRITLLLEKYGRGGVPLYLLFPANANADAKVLPQILSPSKFKRAIEAI